MRLFDIIAALITLAALFSWFNYRFLRLPTAIGLMLIALLASLTLLLPIPGSDGLEQYLKRMLGSIDFDDAVLHGMLGFMLFAGALHVRLADLTRHRTAILLLASVGVLISAVIVGFGAWLLFLAVGLPVPLVYCLLFGALISPTDPIAVLGILKQAAAPKSLENYQVEVLLTLAAASSTSALAEHWLRRGTGGRAGDGTLSPRPGAQALVHHRDNRGQGQPRQPRPLRPGAGSG